VAGAAFLMLTMVTLRGAWHVAIGGGASDADWIGAALDSQVAQTALTIVWSLAGVTAWILGSRRRQRSLWLVGASLMGVVLGKVILIDRSYVGDLAGIVSFAAVGLLLVLVGYIAPSPPKEHAEPRA
jgi:uncharacterized membrane protein